MPAAAPCRAERRKGGRHVGTRHPPVPRKRRHRGPLIGIAVLVTLALVLFVWMISREVDEGVPPGAPSAEAEARPPVQPDASQAITPLPDQVPPAVAD